MIAGIIRWSARNLFLVGLATVFVTVAGIYAVSKVPLDAIPDLSDVQVIVYTEYPGQAPQVVEDQVTYPLTTAMLTVPKARVVRGFSFFGVSFVYVIFDDGTDIYWARSRVLEYLSAAAQRPARRRHAGARARRDRCRLGLSICRARRAEESRRTPHASGLVCALWPLQGARRRRGRERRRLRQAVQRDRRSAPACRRSASRLPRSGTSSATATWTSAAARSNSPSTNTWCAAAATSRASPISSRSSSRARAACRCCSRTSPASSWRRTSAAASPS